MDTTLFSLDTETYGILASETTQTVFHPRRMVFVDRMPLSRILKCVSITLPRHPIHELSLQALADMEPGETLVFDPSISRERSQLIAWFKHSRALLGMNLAFDMLVLRSASPLFAEHLTPSKLLINLAVLNFLENPSRPEKSLKTIGLALNTHKYELSAKNHRFRTLPEAMTYCCEDTHNTLTDIALLCRRILNNPRLTSLSMTTLSMYSETEWSCIQMSENGVPFHRPKLEAVALKHHAICEASNAICQSHSLQLQGEGSDKSKDTFMDALYTAAITKDPSIASSPVLGLTEAHGKLQRTEANRDLLCTVLDPSHPLWAPAQAWNTWTHSDKLIGTYCFPLLWRRRKIHKGAILRTSLLCPQHGIPLPSSLPEPPTCFQQQPSSSESSSSPFSSPVSSSPCTPGTVGPEDSSSASTSLSASPSAASPSTPADSTQDTPKPPTASTPTGLLPSTPPSTPLSETPPSIRTTVPRLNPDVWLSHTSWFIVPSNIKGDNSSVGGTIQGRITCKDGAHQTDPKPLQECWHSRWEGGHLLSGDLSQIELRVPAILSGEPIYLKAYNNGEDIHAYTSTLFWPTEELIRRYPVLANQPLNKWKDLSDSYNDKERQVGKRGNFARGYRSGAENIQRAVQGDIGELLPLEIFQKFVSNMRYDTPKLWEWQERMIREARTTGLVVLPLTGQSRQFGGTNYDVSEICNFPIQTTAGNIMNCIQAEFRRLTWHLRSFIKPFLNIYDALKIDCAPSHLEAAKDALQQAVAIVASTGYWARLCDHYGHRVPLKMDFKIKPC